MFKKKLERGRGKTRNPLLAANAFTTFFAGAAFTLISFPNAILVPAFLAGFSRSLIIVSPGIVILPDDFRASGTSSSRAPMTALHSFFATPDFDAKLSNTAVLVMVAPFLDTAFAFITFTIVPKGRSC